MKRRSTQELRQDLRTQLQSHAGRVESDPQSNPVKLLAYDISKDVEQRSIAFRDIEALVKQISDERAIDRADRLAARSGANELKKTRAKITTLAEAKAKDGFDAFKAWAETPGQGIVFTAHPTFSLTREVRDCLGQIASADNKSERETATAHLKTLPFLPKGAPTLQEEHADTQFAIAQVQNALRELHGDVLRVAQKAFPDQWTDITPWLATVYSWVGYDIDGRTDISWGDAIRLRLEEKAAQLKRYSAQVTSILNSNGNLSRDAESALEKLVDILGDATRSAERDLKLFGEDLSDPENLIAAANNLTRSSSRRLLSLSKVQDSLSEIIDGAESVEDKLALILLRSDMTGFGLGTSRIHFRLNARHVVSGMRAVFGINDKAEDNRTLLQRASKLTRDVEVEPVNFASLALEKSTAHQQMILTAQIHKYIDEDTPIRFLIAETEDALVPLGMLYLARRYGLDNHMDISPLFETADALNNGGRIIDKMLSSPIYREYIEQRGCFAIQTGFSDAGRFMGQIPATLAIERLQSHFARALAKHEIKNVTAIVFNTHGEGNGRGGHPGTIEERVDYVMSPWAVNRFTSQGLPLCHETSFQGGDGFLWFQTPKLALATVASLVAARHKDTSASETDPFYTENEFSWDMYRTLSSVQDSLYHDANYVSLLGGLGQNLLYPTGSRAAKRAKSGSGMFDPRQLRAIPHNAILQQFGLPANIIHGVGRAANIDLEKFITLYGASARARSLFDLVRTSMSRTNVSVLTGYARLYDPAFWISRAISGNEPNLSQRSLIVADTLSTTTWPEQLGQLANRVRMDLLPAKNAMTLACEQTGSCVVEDASDELKMLHALRLAVLMKMMIIAAELPTHGEESTSRLNVLQRLQNFQIEQILEELKQRYPAVGEQLDWTKKLTEKSSSPAASPTGFPHISETIIKPLERASQLVRQISVAITHGYDAFG